MAVPQVHVELPCSSEAESLVDFIAARGLTGSVGFADDHCEIDVRDAVDPDERLRQEFEAALGDWLESLAEPLVVVRIQDQVYVIRPPGD